MNFIIDALMFMAMMAIAGLGFLMEYVLIPGERRWQVYGRNVDLSWLGLDRHAWGDVHYALGMVLMLLLILHIVLHWRSVVGMFRQAIAGAALRIALGVLFVALCAGLLLFPLCIEPEVKESGEGHGRVPRETPPIAAGLDHPAPGTHGSGKLPEKKRPKLHGRMSLGEGAQQYGVSSAVLKNRLGLPEETPNDERLGHLRKSHGFRMSDVERAAGDCDESAEVCEAEPAQLKYEPLKPGR